jgi:flagellar biosynthesis/type III secretory pathway protein FliH
MESEIVRLSIEIAEKVLSAKLGLHPQVVVDIAREAIDMLHDRDQVILYVNPGEAGLFEEKKEELIKHLSPRGELHIVSDHEVGPGGCVAETEYGRVDARLETRWGALLKALEDVNR